MENNFNYFVRTRTSNTPNNEDIPQEKRCVVCLNHEKEVSSIWSNFIIINKIKILESYGIFINI